MLTRAGNPRLVSSQLVSSLCEHAAGNYRTLCTMGAELLAAAAQREAPEIDEKLFFELFVPAQKLASLVPATSVTLVGRSGMTTSL